MAELGWKASWSSMERLRLVLLAAARCGVCDVAASGAGGDVTLQRSARYTACCWTLSVLLAVGNIGCAAVLQSQQGRTMFSLVGPNCEIFLFHVSVCSSFTGLTAERLKEYVNLLKKIDEFVGTTHDHGCTGVITALVFLTLQIVLTLIDTCLAMYHQSVQNSLGIWSIIFVCQMIIFGQFLAVHVLYLFLVYMPIARMHAIEKRLLHLNAMMGGFNDDESDFTIASMNKAVSDIFTIGGAGAGGGRLIALAEQQRRARAAAALLEEALSPSALAAVVVAFTRIFVNCYSTTVSLGEKWRFILSLLWLANYCIMLTLICETCQQFYLADARVTAALTEAAGRRRGADGARELCAGLRASCRAHRYTACRLLVLDRPLILSALATVLTYTVMLYQLQAGLKGSSR